MARICDVRELQPGPAVALTIGVFDGVHRGHQALIGQVIRRGQALAGQSVVLTFFPHPRAVLAPDAPVSEITPVAEKLALIAGLGVDTVATLEFTRELSLLSAEAFIDLLLAHLNLKELWVGPDFALGHRRSGTVDRLTEIGSKRSFSVHTLQPVDIDGERASSSRVRALIAGGEVEQATWLLGRYPRLSGTVVVGERRGRTLGFPTANLSLPATALLPANGIYAVLAEIGGVRYQAVASIGVRPTFGSGARLVEVHILDFNRMIYGEQLVVDIVKRLRDEVRFPNVDALVEQMHSDVADARRELAARTPGS